ncbi:phospho-N-acetylmuramoyl-pentapeptide-transferase [Candidatus Cytomitobacter primus]|uniref:Phospho-N-acetylmuramoyl-pentapeptide-transferase n=1 Tax=Candidatus Cytomitobacter primus TaxID=2066024 RepID=A0A5C0UH38_9PROT|nr:phospho-N-acetylmuramoyl-pentapeptide-transferase [Candidatus Cytomitobacter primus]QEK38354.1 phospho-N-acetylmuramoyl-pentapeptide-transferase [Candidatus Cytomitobacter primus]
MEFKFKILQIVQFASLLLVNRINTSKLYSFIIALLIAPSIAMNFISEKSMYLIFISQISDILSFSMICTFFALYTYIKIKNKKASQPISKYIKKHKHKRNIPTLGGVIFIGIFLLYSFSSLGGSDGKFLNIQHYMIICITVLFGLIGFYDDIIKLYYKNNHGISARYKFLLQFVTSIVILLVFKSYLNLNTNLNIKHFDYLNFNYLTIIWWSFVVVSSANAVNLTDGLDGLAGSCSLVSLLFLITFQIYHFGFSANVALLSIMFATLLSFMQFNKYPAKIFMGDTGSMALGAFLAINHLVISCEWLFILTGCIFVLETLSVIIQIFSIKVFKRKVFIIAPIHHHFEHYFHEKNVTKIFYYFMLIVNLGVLFIYI